MGLRAEDAGVVGQAKDLTGVAGVSGNWCCVRSHGPALAQSWRQKGHPESYRGRGGAAKSIPCVYTVLARGRARHGGE